MSRVEAAASIGALLAHHDAVRPHHQAIVSGQRAWTYPELARDVGAFSRGLTARGVGDGCTLGLLCTNRVEWVIAALGAITAGVRVAAFNTWSKAWDLDHLLRHSECDALAVVGSGPGGAVLQAVGELLPEAWSAAPGEWRSSRYPALRQLIVIGDGGCPPGGTRFEDLLHDGSAGQATPVHASSDENVIFVMYTSGSTARPKAVPLLEATALQHGRDVADRMGVNGDDRLWLAVPLFWSYGGANALMVALTQGCTVVLQEVFEASAALDLIEQHQCTVAYTLPNITAALLAEPSFTPARVATLSKGMTIGSRRDVLAAGVDLGISGICNAYGSTELYGGCCVTPYDWPLERRSEMQGLPLPGMRVTIRDPETGVATPAGEVGEIVVAGQVAPGYLGAPEVSAKTFVDGEYHSGDLGFIDDDGVVHFVGRASEMIKSAGINIAPAEVEEFLCTHDDVIEAAVVGVGDDRRGQVAVAVAVVAAGAVVDEQSLRAWCQKHIASFKVPSRIVVTNEPLPRTDTGKLARKVLQDGLGPSAAASGRPERHG